MHTNSDILEREKMCLLNKKYEVLPQIPAVWWDLNMHICIQKFSNGKKCCTDDVWFPKKRLEEVINFEPLFALMSPFEL